MKNPKIRETVKDLLDGIAAGILISIGGAVFLAMASVNKYVGAFFFSVALLCICYKEYNLFTGKVGSIVEKHEKKDFITLFVGLAGNIIGTLVCGVILSYAIPDLYAAAVTVCDAKVAQELWQTLIRALFCGILMYLAVSIFKDHKTVVGILFCIPVFILSGFEHSIADMAYFATARAFSLKGFLFLLMVVIGNAIGGMLLPAFTLVTKTKAGESGEQKTKKRKGKTMIKIAVLVSGGGTNLQALIDAEKRGELHSGVLSLVLSNKENAYALRRAENAGIKTAVVLKKDYAGQEAFENAILETLRTNGIDFIVLAGFMSILGKHFTDAYKDRIINVHPSLIPSFCGEGFYGLKVHEAALQKGVKVTGATVHFVNEIPDGGKIIMQKAVEIRDDDTPETLQRRVMEEAEWKILPAACEKICKQISEESI